MLNDMNSTNCPRCQRPLEATGEAVVDGIACPVFQCDRCLVHVEMFGVKVDVALTFAVGLDGRAFDPATPDGALPPGEPG